MSARKKYNPADYEPCPAGCGGQRWRGADLPVCDACSIVALSPLSHLWSMLRNRLVRDNASLDVLNPFDQALIAECKESLQSAASERPLRRKHQ